MNGVKFIAYLCALLLLASQVTWSISSMPSKRHILPQASTQPLSMKSQSATKQKEAKLGREAFYKETFGNEILFTDVMGIFDGAFTMKEIVKATVRLHGQGTTNLRVRLTKDVTVGGKHFQEGEFLDTGLDVPRGSALPLGITTKLIDGKPKIGISCIMCHAVYVPQSKKVIEGVPNPDVNVGTILALGTNTAAFFTHTDIKNVRSFMQALKPGAKVALPDAQQFEEAVDEAIVKWPAGMVDTMIDQASNPVNIPDTFTKGDFPYSWNGLAPIGPEHGLVFLSGIPHGQNMDPLSQAPLADKYYGLSEDEFLGIALQNASNERYRYDPQSGMTPTEFFAKVDPTPGAPGINELVPTPDAPKSSFVSLVGMIASKPGYPIATHLKRLAAFQNTMHPPSTGLRIPIAERKAGRDIFMKANCISCHAGNFLTNNRVVAQEVVGTQPSRALALKATEHNWGENMMYDWSVRVPLASRDKQNTFKVPYTTAAEDVKRTLAWGESRGGYKVPSLFGLLWSAPYLHDGGVAVGAKELQIGVSETVYKGILPDATNSLRALLDRQLRTKVLAANKADERLIRSNISGEGHAYWVDEEAGYTMEQQTQLIRYLLSLTDSPMVK